MKPNAPDIEAPERQQPQHFGSALSGLRSNKKKPRLVESPPPAEKQFVDGARNHSLPEAGIDWRALDPKAPTTRGMNVRFNENELGLVRELAEREDRSMHKIIRRYLIPALRAALEEAD